MNSLTPDSNDNPTLIRAIAVYKMAELSHPSQLLTLTKNTKIVSNPSIPIRLHAGYFNLILSHYNSGVRTSYAILPSLKMPNQKS